MNLVPETGITKPSETIKNCFEGVLDQLYVLSVGEKLLVQLLG